MPIMAPRERVIDTFVAQELANASATMITNSRQYRALQGEFVNEELKASGANSLPDWYKKCMREMDAE